MDIGAKLFVAAICLTLASGICVLVDLSSGHTGSFTVHLVFPLALAAVIANLLANYVGFLFYRKLKMLRWWWPFSILGTLGMGVFACFLAGL